MHTPASANLAILEPIGAEILRIPITCSLGASQLALPGACPLCPG
jgi:hypothetical protein